MTEYWGSDAAEVVVITHWTDLLGSTPDSVDTDFFEVGGTAGTASQLAARLSRASSADISTDMVLDGRTLRKISAQVRETGLSLRRWIPLSTSGSGVPLIMLPSGACTVTGYHRLGGRALGRPVYGLQAHGLNPGDGWPLDNLPDVMTDFAGILRDNLETRRIHLGGYCWGGVLAYELARFLRADGWDVVSILLMNPQLEFRTPTTEDILRNQLSVLAKSATSQDDDTGDGREPVGQAALEEDDPQVFGPRFHVFAMLWRALVGYRPGPVDVPVRLFLTPAHKTGDRWATVGLADLCRYDVPGIFEDVMRDAPSIERIRVLLTELEQRK